MPREDQLGRIAPKTDTTTTADIPQQQTWNTCPDCGHDWADETPTPGLLHRTRLCDRCKRGGHV